MSGGDGPPHDRMGREMADGPNAVRATLASVEVVAPEFQRLSTAAARIVLVGTGASLAVSRAAAPAWRRRLATAGDGSDDRQGPIVRQASDAALGDLDGSGLRSTDLVIAVSQSGTTPETLAAARLAGTAGAAVVALTAHRDSPLSNDATLIVGLGSGKEADASTKSALAALAALLAMGGVIGSDPSSAAATDASLDAMAASGETAEDLGRLLAGARRTWCLGFGSALGIAEAAALLWHEKVVRQMVAATPAEFRHGLVEATAPGDAVVLLDVDAPDVHRAAYLDRMRDELVTLGVTLVELAPGSPIGTGGRAPDLPLASADPGVRILESLLRIQQLARATALAGGTYRDGFRILRETVKPAVEILDPSALP